MAASMASATYLKKVFMLSLNRQLFCKKCRNGRILRYCSTTAEETKDHPSEIFNPDSEMKSADIDELRNFSNLPTHLRQRVNGIMPDMEHYEQMTFKDNTERKMFLRKLYAKYGTNSNIDPGVCWPSKQELESTKLDDAILEPTFQQMVMEHNKERDAELSFRKQLTEKVEKSMAKMDSVLKAYNDKEQKEFEKEQEAELKKKVLLDEAEEYYGYPVKPSSVDFKTFMEKKREEEAKAKKLARKMKKKARVGPMLQKVTEQL